MFTWQQLPLLIGDATACLIVHFVEIDDAVTMRIDAKQDSGESSGVGEAQHFAGSIAERGFVGSGADGESVAVIVTSDDQSYRSARWHMHTTDP